MNAETIKKFASDACTVIDACQQMISDQEQEISGLKDQLNKQASALEAAKAAPKAEAAAKLELNADLLSKAASAVHTLYGSPEKVSPEAIADAWSSKPDLMLNIITKFASDIATRAKVSGSDLGEPIAKKASANVSNESADSIFRSKYNY